MAGKIEIVLDLDETCLEFKEAGIKIGSNNFIIRELDAEGGKLYRNALASAIKRNDESKESRLENFHDRDFILVANCIGVTNQNGDFVKLPPTVVSGWPDRVFNKVLEACKKLNGFDQKKVESQAENLGEEGEPKN